MITRFQTPHYVEAMPKRSICLHFTAGPSAMSAINTFKGEKKYNLGTPLLVDRDPAASVYQLFDPKFWAYHLAAGVGNEKSVIGIEIVNWGWLTFDEQNQRYVTSYAGMVVPASQVKRQTYRRQQYFQTFPPAQVKAVADLVKELCKEFKIPAICPPTDKRGICAPEWVSAWRGICDHTNFRADKFDMGPAWDWTTFQEMIR